MPFPSFLALLDFYLLIIASFGARGDFIARRAFHRRVLVCVVVHLGRSAIAWRASAVQSASYGRMLPTFSRLGFSLPFGFSRLGACPVGDVGESCSWKRRGLIHVLKRSELEHVSLGATSG